MLPAAAQLARDAMERAQRTERPAPGTTTHPLRRRTAALLHALAHRVDVPRAARSG